jgi:hypothetical protein
MDHLGQEPFSFSPSNPSPAPRERASSRITGSQQKKKGTEVRAREGEKSMRIFCKISICTLVRDYVVVVESKK